MAGTEPIGAVLAGGRSRRMGGSKATADLGGRPLIAWPLEALRAVLDEVVVVAKRSTALPPLDVAVWVEPDEPLHPRAGLVHALERADGRSVLICAADLPLVTPLLVRMIACADGTPAVVPRADGRLQPLLARYEPAALEALRAAPADEALTATVEALGPRVLEVTDSTPFLNINTPEDLEEVAQRIARRS
jgi:molybdopterin-guanine dinucleotide biosynthesis protein A